MPVLPPLLPSLPMFVRFPYRAPRPRPPGRLALVGGACAALALGSALVAGLVGGRS